MPPSWQYAINHIALHKTRIGILLSELGESHKPGARSGDSRRARLRGGGGRTTVRDNLVVGNVPWDIDGGGRRECLAPQKVSMFAQRIHP